MQLLFASKGETGEVSDVIGSERTRRRLTDMGFVEGARVRMVSSSHGCFIVEIMGTKIALDAVSASMVMVRQVTG